jgi:hypothetical protein
MAQSPIEDEKFRFNALLTQLPAQACGQTPVSGADLQHPHATLAGPMEEAAQ